MKTFKEYIQESKNIGTIYHFTKMNTILDLLNLDKQKKYGVNEIFTLLSLNGKISTTRNYNLSNDFGNSFIHSRNGYIVRIALNGDLISEKFKIKPVLGLNNSDQEVFDHDKNSERMSRHDHENEELIMTNKLPISKYIKRIDFLSVSGDAVRFYENSIKPKLDLLGIKNETRKVWLPVKMEESFETNNSGFEIIV